MTPIAAIVLGVALILWDCLVGRSNARPLTVGQVAGVILIVWGVVTL